MRLKLTPFKFPFVATELLVGLMMLTHAYNNRNDAVVMLGSVSVAALATYCAFYILSDEE